MENNVNKLIICNKSLRVYENGPTKQYFLSAIVEVKVEIMKLNISALNLVAYYSYKLIPSRLLFKFDN